MRLLLASNAHRPGRHGLEIAASPDSNRPEPWQWDLAIGERHRFTGVRSDVDVAIRILDSGSSRHLRLCHHRRDIAADVDVIDIDEPLSLKRPEREVWILVGIAGQAREGGRRIGLSDALILEGDDPTHIELTVPPEARATLARFRLRRTHGADLRWVP